MAASRLPTPVWGRGRGIWKGQEKTQTSEKAPSRPPRPLAGGRGSGPDPGPGWELSVTFQNIVLLETNLGTPRPGEPGCVADSEAQAVRGQKPSGPHWQPLRPFHFRAVIHRTCLFLGVAEVKEKTPVFTVYLLVPFESRATALHCLPRKADKENRLLEKRLPPPASPSMGSVPLPPSPPPPQSTGPSTSSCWGERTRGPWRAPSPLSVSPSEMCPGSPVTGTGKGLAENGAAELLPQPLLVGPRRPKTQGHAGVGGGPHCETPMAPSRSLFPERWDGHLGRRVKIRAWEIDKLLESIFCILPVVEAFSLQKVGEMLEEVGAGWREVR
nr:uncharacterized protein LOC105861111 isoform X6 [Microcebus murinus]XP_012601873.1 uncharacterized protein LOC105861111 isoform X6 [Microcebus murinus]XP_012601874.1 uncharacterized protein LOC105861111 isoform X6 [Microcebus murinus]XP_012601875.1 uncharacterized protein LOC105861111 isoform X6 [Microcebus murinus]XP_012601876.1 uncharacterized protein LOC105861111 isoform X6 [Microcebus murinus]XP_012601877.1 uncharacterized protein LOC105861111 isoform X6 [Microcebus murinus]XP_01260187